VEPLDSARRADLADLVTTERPDVRLSGMTLAPATRAHLELVLHEQRRRDLLTAHGFAPLHRLLITGPPGTGKSMTAAALATELSLPLVTIRLDGLTSRHTGEIAVKLRVVYDAMAHPRTVYRFDGLDAIEARLETLHEMGEARRILDMFLTFLEETHPESLVVAVAEHAALLDEALLRRFDAAIPCALPNRTQALDLLRRHLVAVNTSTVAWDELADHVSGLSQAGLVRAAESAAKQTILSGNDSLSTTALITAMAALRRTRHVTGFAPLRLPGRCPGPGLAGTAGGTLYTVPIASAAVKEFPQCASWPSRSTTS
jgi:SpoVK/Ycf46/Vps4 family AAA+-type ATPase